MLSRFDIWLRTKLEARYGPLTEWRLYKWLESPKADWLFTSLGAIVYVWDHRALRYSVAANIVLFIALIVSLFV